MGWGVGWEGAFAGKIFIEGSLLLPLVPILSIIPEYQNYPDFAGATTEVLESLISINNKLHNPEAANGVLLYAMNNQMVDYKVQVCGPETT